MSSRKNSILELINTFAPDGIGAEIGVAKGGLSRYILDRTNTKFIYLVDQWIGGYNNFKGKNDGSQEKMDDRYRHVKSVFENKYVGRSKIIKKSSIEASKEIEDNSLDFVYIDASHEYPNVLQDLKCWVPKVKPNKLIMGDDWIGSFAGVIQAVIEYAKNYDDFVGPMAPYDQFNFGFNHCPCPTADPVVNKCKHQWWTLKKSPVLD